MLLKDSSPVSIGLPVVRRSRYTEQYLNPDAPSSGTKAARFQFFFEKS